MVYCINIQLLFLEDGKAGLDIIVTCIREGIIVTCMREWGRVGEAALGYLPEEVQSEISSSNSKLKFLERACCCILGKINTMLEDLDSYRDRELVKRAHCIWRLSLSSLSPFLHTSLASLILSIPHSP